MEQSFRALIGELFMKIESINGIGCNLINIKSSIVYKLMISIIFFTFIFSYQLRCGLLGDKIGGLNIVGLALIILLFLLYFNNMDKKYMILVYVVNMCVFISAIYSNKSIYKGFVVSGYFTIPLILIGINLKKNLFIEFTNKYIKVLNILMIIITLMGILDIATNQRLMVFVSKFMTSKTQELINTQIDASIANYRMYSLMGHPLFNTQLYLMFYTININYTRYFNKILDTRIVTFITILGIVLTKSKSGMILLVICLLVQHAKKIKIRNFIISFLAIIFLFFSGIFNNTIERFDGSLTSGRNEMWDLIQQSNMYPIKVFSGYGLGATFRYNDIIKDASSAFEYPLRMFSFEIGMLPSILIFSCLLYPILKLIRRRQYSLAIAYGIIFSDVNTYNGLSLQSDNMIILCLFIVTILNISNYTLKIKERSGQSI
ncbi:hypothetical protein CLOBE_31770 [Clostridium beijerinckii]|nr:hypothetical protein CLOBE_31770 [Clostridium beijerinckii]